MHIVECGSCDNAFKAEAKLAGSTIPCPVCGADIYIPQTPDGSFVSCGKMPIDELGRQPTVSTTPQTPVETPPPKPVPYLLAVGWVTLALAVCMLILSTPATYLLWIILNIAAIAVSITIARTNLKAGLPLLAACVVIPATISVVFWVQVGQETERIAAKLQSDMDKMNRQITADLEAGTKAMSQLLGNTAAQLTQTAPRPRVTAPRPLQPVSQTPNWSAAKADIRVGGTVFKNGEIFALINGALHRHGEMVETVLGPFTYYFRIRIRDKSAEITPVRSVRR